MADQKTLRKHAALMDEMASRQGVDLQEAAIAEQAVFDEISDALVRCTKCSNPEACAKWLTDAPAQSDMPDYCRNREMFEQLRP